MELHDKNLHKAQERMRNGDFKNAAITFQRVLKGNPYLTADEQIFLIRQICICYEHLNKFSKIFKLLARYVNKFPSHSLSNMYIRTVMSHYYIMIGNFKKAIEIGQQVYKKLLPTNEQRTFALIQRNLGIAYLYTGQVQTAREFLESSLHIFKRLNETSNILFSLSYLAVVHEIYSNWDTALEYRKSVLKTAKKLKIKKWEIPALLNLALTYKQIGRWKWAERLAKLGISELQNDRPDSPHSIRGKIILAGIYIYQRRFAEASELLNSIIEVTPGESSKIDLYSLYSKLGQLKYLLKDYSDALTNYRKAHRIIMKIAPESSDSAEICLLLSECYLDRGKIAKARLYLEKALSLSQRLRKRLYEAISYKIQARILLAEDNTNSAIYYYEKAIEILDEIAEIYERGKTLLEYGKFLSRQGNYFQALRQLQKAEDLLKKLPSEYWIANAHLAMAENYCRANDYDLALKYIEMSRKVFERLKEKESLIEVEKLRNKIENGMLEYALFRANKFAIPDEDIGNMLSYLREKTGSRSLILLSRENGSFEIFKDIGATPGLKEFVKQFVNERNLRKPLLSTGMINQREFAFLKKQQIGSFLFLPFSQSDDSIVLYLDKKEPFKQDEMIFSVRFSRALAAKLSELKQKELKEQNLQLIRELRKREFPNIITKNSRMLDILDLVDKIKDDTTPVLIEGETGTGKELIARAIHYRSKRSSKPFVPVDCGALPEGLAESLLFGHRKGAFTGALQDSPGFFEEAHKGTLFLDEISNLSPKVQAKLLRVLQDGTIRRLGEHRSRKVDVRIIAASNVDLEEAVRKGDFRKDLFYRLKGIRIKLPPLRERKEDIPLLVQYFVSKYSREKGKKVRKITQEAINALMAHDWDGNVRELEREIERAIVLMEDGNITPDLFSFVNIKNRKAQYTIEEVLEALKRNNWVIRKTARYLGISESTLRKRLKSNGIHLTAGAQGNA